MLKNMCQFLTSGFLKLVNIISDGCKSTNTSKFRDCVNKLFKNNKGDKVDGLYNEYDCKDETELVSILNNNIIHPYKEDSCVIFHNENDDKYRYDRLPSVSPPQSIENNEKYRYDRLPSISPQQGRGDNKDVDLIDMDEEGKITLNKSEDA